MQLTIFVLFLRIAYELHNVHNVDGKCRVMKNNDQEKSCMIYF